MDIIFNSLTNNLTKYQMQDLYRKNLIMCDDFTFKVATIPSFAVSEVESTLGKTIHGSEGEFHVNIKNKKDVAFYNHTHYPDLYEQTCPFNGISYDSGYKVRYPIIEGHTIQLYHARILIKEVVRNKGFYYQVLYYHPIGESVIPSKSDEIRYCDTQMGKLNFTPIYKSSGSRC